MKEKNYKKIKGNAIKGIYIIPNFLTTVALFSGFYSIIAAINGQFNYAALAIFIGLVFDGLDGRVARLINSQSDFGAMYDSLSDVLVFGLAPALISYLWALKGFGKIGWLIAFYYTAATALRLARFNSQLSDDIDGPCKFFKGLPCPAAASSLVGFIWLCNDSGMVGTGWTHIAVACFAIINASLMISNVRYNSFKNIDVRKKVPALWGIIGIMAIIVVMLHPPIMLFAIFQIYVVSGIIQTIYLRRRVL